VYSHDLSGLEYRKQGNSNLGSQSAGSNAEPVYATWFGSIFYDGNLFEGGELTGFLK
jgi:hypothetical protein